MNYVLKKIGDIANTLTGYPFDSNLFNETEGFPIIRIRDLKSKGTKTLYKGDVINEFIINNGDFLIGMDGEFNLVEWNYGEALLNQRVCKLSIHDSNIDHKYVYYFLPKKLKEIEAVTPFVTVKHLSHKSILDIDIPLPPLPIQKRIAAILEKADAAREKRRQTIALTEQFLQSAFLDMFGDPVTNPKGWEEISIRDAGRIVTGTTPSSNNKGMFGGEIPFITPGDLESNDECKRFVTKEGADNSRVVREGTTFVCCIGATIGKVGRASVLSAFNQQINAIEWNNEFTDLFGEMLMRFMKPVIIQKGSNSTTLPILNKGNFERLDIIKPPLSLQQEFAALVEKVEVMRAKQRESERELEQLFGSLMQRAFSGELV